MSVGRARAAAGRGATRLAEFDNSWFRPGRLSTRAVWLAASRIFFETRFPWPSRVKAQVLRAFGASIGVGVVLKPRISIKYPWNVWVGDYSWVGEGVWIDSLAKVKIGSNCCLSQGVMIETGNHDWSKPTFDLIVKEVVVEDGAWAAVRSLLLPGARLRSHAVLAAGSVLAGDTAPYAIYSGILAKKTKRRRLDQP